MSAQRLRDAAAHVRLTTDQYPPCVGLALADWLDAEADVPYYTPKAYGTADGVTSAAHRLADLILGGTP